MSEQNYEHILKTLIVDKPWGNYLEFIRNTPATVKILTINPGESISLQKHAERDEFWLVLSGNGTVTVGDQEIEVVVGAEYHIKRGMQHRMSAGSHELKVLEIALGNADENEIVRLEDKYGRIDNQIDV
jgi:mannose-6-phosphate isomerase-like protein (cupin superfamily)